MKPLGRLKNIKGSGVWKRSYLKYNNWWEEMSEPISNKSARRKLKNTLKKEFESGKFNDIIKDL